MTTMERKPFDRISHEPSKGYRMTLHARLRIDERGYTPDQLANALAGHHWVTPEAEYFYSRSDRVLIVACPLCLSIVTIYTLSPKQARRKLSRGSGGIHAPGSYERGHLEGKWHYSHDQDF